MRVGLAHMVRIAVRAAFVAAAESVEPGGVDRPFVRACAAPHMAEVVEVHWSVDHQFRIASATDDRAYPSTVAWVGLVESAQLSCGGVSSLTRLSMFCQ